MKSAFFWVCVGLALTAVYWIWYRDPTPTPSYPSKPDTTQGHTTPRQDNTTTSRPTNSTGFPFIANKPRPVSPSWQDCPGEGDGGDGELNLLKNRVDEGNYIPVAFNDVLNLPFPDDARGKWRKNWSRATKNEVARYEGTPISIEGYIAKVRKQGPESPNCHGYESDWVDYHTWLVGSPNDDRPESIVVEPTPRTRAKHPNWDVANLNQLVQRKSKVRISGWLMLDPEHPDQIGKTRGTIWEIHPVMKMEVQDRGRWVNLDQYNF